MTRFKDWVPEGVIPAVLLAGSSPATGHFWLWQRREPGRWIAGWQD